MEQPLVSICCITYNHVNYIVQAIQGFLMQKTAFPIEIIINDDASTDGTTEILREYEKKYPELIFPIYHEENEYSKGIRGIMACNTFPRARGKYIAICEGDDYWTDPLKLQKQVDFLERNNEYSMVCHDALVINLIYNSSKLYFDSSKKKQVCSTKDTLNIQFCPTASILFRKNAISSSENLKILALAQAGDQILVQVLSMSGLLYRMYDVMSVYRKTSTGMSEMLKKDLIGNLENRISTLNYLNKISNHKYQKYIRIENLLIQNRIDLLKSRSKLRTSILKKYRTMLLVIKRII